MVQPPTVFYKDQARQSKFFTIIVVLVDEKNKIVNGLKVPLNIKVTYDTGEEITGVYNPVFILNPKACEYEIGEDGFGELLIRLNHVSKNHNGKKFVVQIEADKRYLQHGVCVKHATSHPTTVMSTKTIMSKNKRGNREGRSERKAVEYQALAKVFQALRQENQVLIDENRALRKLVDKNRELETNQNNIQLNFPELKTNQNNVQLNFPPGFDI
eukprot:CAMPEP_0167751922 /NCGR_PEP_ID=MMETSP0110_2-20121227/6844_1 /TAXON_ID=629695 /ORGANISM="Gymnochlora sp., Strain CCMP2014" /LENGTH=213 /DNA_ID=CAMNT_0007637465 /DNA_START=95 /DNA_END=736 /DNA_ORIENTATION=+